MQINYGNLLNAIHNADENATIKPEMVFIETNDGHYFSFRCFVQNKILHIVLDDFIVSLGEFNLIRQFCNNLFTMFPLTKIKYAYIEQPVSCMTREKKEWGDWTFE
jgi:hypothetical protein